MRRALTLLCALALLGCPTEAPPPAPITGFQVKVLGVFERNGATRAPLAVSSACVAIYGSQAAVPADVRGQPGCRYIIPRGEVEFDIKATAVGLDGQPYRDFNNSVAFRVVPGDLPNDLTARWAMAALGEVEATVRAVHPYGEVRVWVEDAPPKLVYDGGVVAAEQLPAEVQKRTWASGASPIVYFGDQTLQSLQRPGELDNRSSPFVGEFVVVGKDPTSGETLKQTCLDDPSRNGRDALMVVTGLDPAGFYVTDISACRLVEQTNDSTGASVRQANWEPPETCWLELPDGGRTENLDGGMGTCLIGQKSCRKTADCSRYLPGTYASMFVYNYNFPDGLDEGDLLFTLSGSVQEFTSTTQMVFPAWTVAERVRRLPQDQWNKWLQYARPYDLGGRTCGQDDVPAPYITDALCGHNRRNMKMESLESSLVRARRVRFPKRFVNCDFNANGSVPFFCETKPDNGDWQWGSCAFGTVEPEADRVERECNQNCVIGMGEHTGVICSEESTFLGFGQFVVEMAMPGPARVGLDDQLPSRTQTVVTRLYVPPDAGVPDAGLDDGGVDGGMGDAGMIDAGVPQNPSFRVSGYAPGVEIGITCDRPTRVRFGDDTVVAFDSTIVVQADLTMNHVFATGENSVAFQAIDAPSTCVVGLNAHTRLNLVTKDAVPELSPDCDENDSDEDKATQCRYLRGAEFDVIGHLKQVQPARPRWMIVPRAADDLCCYPGPGMECPRPIRRCQ
ncbi:MAG: hypothetical protein ACOZQL_13385 [Myxococcota bacterium]